MVCRLRKTRERGQLASRAIPIQPISAMSPRKIVMVKRRDFFLTSAGLSLNRPKRLYVTASRGEARWVDLWPFRRDIGKDEFPPDSRFNNGQLIFLPRWLMDRRNMFAHPWSIHCRSIFEVAYVKISNNTLSKYSWSLFPSLFPVQKIYFRLNWTVVPSLPPLPIERISFLDFLKAYLYKITWSHVENFMRIL